MDVSVGPLVDVFGGGNVRVGGKVITGISEPIGIREQPASSNASRKTSNRIFKYEQVGKQVFLGIKGFLFYVRELPFVQKERAKPEAPPLFSIV